MIGIHSAFSCKYLILPLVYQVDNVVDNDYSKINICNIVIRRKIDDPEADVGR